MKKFLLLTSISCLFYFPSYSQLTNENKMKNVAVKLIQFLSNRDTASIVRLHFNYHDSLLAKKEYKESLKPVLRDCDTFKKAVAKYELPKEKDFKFRDGILGSHEIVIDLIPSKDVEFNMNYCRLVINFYPFELVVPDKIRNYMLEVGRERPPLKIIEPLPMKKG